MHRTHTCGELGLEHIGQEVTLAGWVGRVRNMGGLCFIDLRDRYGVTQISINIEDEKGSPINRDKKSTNDGFGGWNGSKGHIDIVDQLKNEYVIKVLGTVVRRPEGMGNDDMLTGAIEIVPRSIEILNTCKEIPFNMGDDPKTSEENRFTYRYVDLRRKKVLNNMIFKSKMCAETRKRFSGEGFLEIQTPLFTVSSPEGARDFVIPSRIHPGKFYALPQAPQQYKQLLMVGGVDKYFQIAPCFRDEDPRADRHQCEFYQVDLEMSFVEQEDVLHVLEGYARFISERMVPHKKVSEIFQRISYADAMTFYGNDRPDMRFDMRLTDVSSLFINSGFEVFAKTVADGGVVKTLKLEAHHMVRKEIDEITDFVKHMGLGGLAYLLFDHVASNLDNNSGTKLGGLTVRGSFVKFLKDEDLRAIIKTMDVKAGDMLFFASGELGLVSKVLGKLRLALRDKYQLVSDSDLCYCFVLDFPFYELNEESGKLDFGHNPFSLVDGGVEALKSSDPLSVMTFQYDLVLNGFELGSGSIRNHDPEVLVKVFEKVGLSEEDVKKRFGAMYEAFHYGCPPHGGFAFGLDRHMMVLLDEPNVRECYAFPKSGKGEDLMMGAPSDIDEEQLKELHILVRGEEG